MYELIKNELQQVETITTPNQKATVRTTIEKVYGNKSKSVIKIELIPEKKDYYGKSELHYINGALEWIYKPYDVDLESIKKLYKQNIITDLILDSLVKSDKITVEQLTYIIN